MSMLDRITVWGISPGLSRQFCKAVLAGLFSKLCTNFMHRFESSAKSVDQWWPRQPLGKIESRQHPSEFSAEQEGRTGVIDGPSLDVLAPRRQPGVEDYLLSESPFCS